jgi:hypothetical protein
LEKLHTPNQSGVFMYLKLIFILSLIIGIFGCSSDSKQSPQPTIGTTQSALDWGGWLETNNSYNNIHSLTVHSNEVIPQLVYMFGVNTTNDKLYWQVVSACDAATQHSTYAWAEVPGQSSITVKSNSSLSVVSTGSYLYIFSVNKSTNHAQYTKFYATGASPGYKYVPYSTPVWVELSNLGDVSTVSIGGPSPYIAVVTDLNSNPKYSVSSSVETWSYAPLSFGTKAGGKVNFDTYPKQTAIMKGNAESNFYYNTFMPTGSSSNCLYYPIGSSCWGGWQSIPNPDSSGGVSSEITAARVYSNPSGHCQYSFVTKGISQPPYVDTAIWERCSTALDNNFGSWIERESSDWGYSMDPSVPVTNNGPNGVDAQWCGYSSGVWKRNFMFENTKWNLTLGHTHYQFGNLGLP